MKAIGFLGLLAASALGVAQTQGAQVFNFSGQYLIEMGNSHNWTLNIVGNQYFTWYAVPGQNGAVQLTMQGGQTLSSLPVAGESYFDFYTTVPGRSFLDDAPLRFQWILDNSVRGSSPDSLDTAQFFYGPSLSSLTFVPLSARSANGVFPPLTLPTTDTIIGWRLVSGHDVGADVLSIQAFAAPVPEPSIFALAAVAAGAAFCWRRKTRG